MKAWHLPLLVCISVLAVTLVLPLTTTAAEPEACWFGLLACEDGQVVWEYLETENGAQVAQLASTDGLVETIIKVGYFLKNVILPLLVFVAFVFLLYQIARYLIFTTGDENRTKGKKTIVWGIAALIIIASLWGIVNLLVAGFEIDREESLCPDYLGSFCGNLGYNRTAGTFSGSSNLDFGGSSPTRPGSGSGSGSGSVSVTDEVSDSGSPLGELVFGDRFESVRFTYLDGGPRAAAQAVTIPPTASCEIGLATMQLAAEVENLRSAYLMYTENTEIQWQNITDVTSANSLAYDADLVRATRLATTSKLVVIHSHPQSVISSVGLTGTAYAPMPKKLESMCSGVADDATYAVVDANHIWTITKTAGTCPRRSSEEDDLATIAVLLQLSTMPSDERVEQFARLLDWDELPSYARRNLNDYDDINFAALTQSQIFNLADDLARDGGMQIRKQTIDNFCASY